MPNKDLWVGIGKQILSFVVGVIVAAFILGRNSQRINAVIEWQKEAQTRWKTDVQPRIERMDRQGSISFDNFHKQYEKEQAQQYARLQKLDDEVKHLETMQLRIDRLERNAERHP